MTKAEAEMPKAAPPLASVIAVPNDAADEKAVVLLPEEPKAIVESKSRFSQMDFSIC